MQYDIIATLGPATANPDAWRALLTAGATAFRLNTSHLSIQETVLWFERLDASLGVDRPEVVFDLQGSKWRIGDIRPRELHRDAEIVLVHSTEAGNSPSHIPIPHADFFAAVPTADGVVRMNDGRVELSVVAASDREVRCRVTKERPISPRKGVSVPGSTVRREGLLPKDSEIVAATRNRRNVSYALSYLRDAAEMRALGRDLPDATKVIAKIERPESLADAVAISDNCDEVWLCRGDLGAEIGGPAMARGVHEFTARLSELACPAVLAGQVLEHMTRENQPTRSELCHLFDVLHAGYAGVVLSDETAVGSYPVQSCATAASYSTSSLDKG